MSLRWRAIWVGMDSENLSITDRGTQWPRAMASPEAGKILSLQLSPVSARISLPSK